MFNFMKKGAAEKEEKEKRKKEKKERKESKKRDRGSMTTEELLRLDEVRRSLKIRGRRKEKEKLPSGITADYSASFFASLEQGPDYPGGSSSLPGHNYSGMSGTPLHSTGANSSWVRSGDTLTQSDSSEASLTSLNNPTTSQHRSLPPLPPKPPKRGILKGPRLHLSGVIGETVVQNGENHTDSNSVLVRNTLQNEVITYQNVPQAMNNCHKLTISSTNISVMKESPSGEGFPVSCARKTPDGKSDFQLTSPVDSSRTSDENIPSSMGSADQNSYLSPPITVSTNIEITNKLLTVTSASPSADSLTDTTTTNSSFATPPFSLSPIGESQGFVNFHNRWNRYSSGGLEDCLSDLPLPAIIPVPLPRPRVLTVQRQPPPRNDFGFSLRRAMVVERLANGQTKTVIFAEPGTIVQHNNETGLLPGDRLLEVNGIVVDDKSREEIIDLIKSSGSSVTVKVQPVPELCELTRRSATDGSAVELADDNIRGGTLRRSGSRRFRATNVARSEEQLASERAWLEAERLWLAHRAGFTACRRLPPDAPASPAGGGGDAGDAAAAAGAGKVRVRVESSGDALLVDEDDVEKANPPQFDRAEDLAQLRYLNESSALHTLRQRFGSNLIHTYAGGSMVVVNPMAPLAVYSEKVVHMFRGCKSEDMPPHVYAVAQSAYQSMLQSRRDSSVVFLGRSGSGKTSNFRHVLQYLVLAAGSVNKVLTVEKLNAISTVLESFGNCRTVLNSNATRFTQIFSLDFDQSGQIASASLQTLLVERTRVARRPQGEPTFHIFYRLLAGVEGTLRKELFLDNIGAEQNLFMTSLQKHEDKQKALVDFTRVQGAMEVLGISTSEAKVLWFTLAAIYHLGVAGAVKVGNSSSGRWQFANPRSAQYAAHLLGTTVEELARTLFGQGQGGVGTPSTPRTPFRTPSPTERANDREVTGMEALEGLVTGLYGEVFNAVGALINRSISAPIHTVSSLVVIDTPGFQNPASCGQQGGATFEDLCHNYLQERLQLLFHHTMLVAPRDRYSQEHIDVNLDEGEGESCSPQQLVAMMDRAAQSAVVRSSQTDLRQSDRRGLLWLLDEEAVQPAASDEGFLERLFAHYGDREHQLLLRRAPGNNQFVLQHLQGTNPVLYTATGWLKVSRENPVARCAASFLQESTKEEVSQLFMSIRGTGVSSTLGGSVVGIEGTQSLRRASSIRRTFTTGTAGIKRKSVCLQVKFTVDGLIETLRRTKLNFVHCFLPQHNAGSCDMKGGSLTRAMANMSPEEALINIPLIRSQLRGAQLLDSIRLHKQGFPKFLPLSEFQRRFRLLAPAEGRPSSPVLDERRAVEDMLLGIDVDGASYRIGLSQTAMPTAAWSAKCSSPTKTLVQRQLSNSSKTNVKPVSPPRSKTVNGKTKPVGEANNSQLQAKTPLKNGSTNNGSTAEKGNIVPRVVAAEMKTTAKKSPSDPSRSSSTCMLSAFPSSLLHGSPSSKKELTRCSSTEGVLERRGYPARPNSRQSVVQPTNRNGKSELKRCFSSEGILERKGMGQKNLSLSRKSSGENLSSMSDTAKSYGAKYAPNQRKSSLPSTYRVNKTVIKNTVTASSSKDVNSKPKYISSGLKSMIEIPGNSAEGENLAEVKSVIEISGNETKEEETPPEIPPFPSLESIGVPSKNLSTIIAVDFVTNHEDMVSSPPPAHASSTIQVVQDSSEQPLSSTIIAVNYDVSTEVNKPQMTPEPNAQIFSGKSSVWSRLQSKSQAQPSASTNVAVNINIKQEVEEMDNKWNSYPPLPPPPVPPLPSNLLENNFDATETAGQLPPPPVLPPRRNRTSHYHDSSAAQGSKIPVKIPPSLTSLPGTDCRIVCSEEDGMKSNNVEDCTEESTKKKTDWDALFKKYEALEKECDSASTTESEGIEMQHSSLTTIDSSEDDKKSCTEMLVTPLESSEDEKSCKNLVLTSIDNSEETIKVCDKDAVSSVQEYESSDVLEVPVTVKKTIENENSLSRLSTSSTDSVGEENVVTDMPLIQPVTSISIQQCETLYKAKVAKVLAEDPTNSKGQETEREISEEIFDVSLLCKKHLEKVQKSTVKVVASVSKSEVRDTKRKDCSPLILKKCEQWSIEKEKVLVSQRPPAASENMSRNPQFAMTIAKFEQQQHVSEKDNKKVSNDTVPVNFEKISHDKQESNKIKFSSDIFESSKEKCSKIYKEDKSHIVHINPNELSGINDIKQTSKIREVENPSNAIMKEEKLVSHAVQSRSEHHSKYNTAATVGSVETCQGDSTSKYDTFEGKCVGKKFAINPEDNSKCIVTEKKTVSDICQSIQCRSENSRDIHSKFQLKPLPLIPSVPRTEVQKLVNETSLAVNGDKQCTDKINAGTMNSCLIREFIAKDNYSKPIKSLAEFENENTSASINTHNFHIYEMDIKVPSKLPEHYLSVIEKTKNIKSNISNPSICDSSNKGRGVDLGYSKSHTENNESISKFELQRSKFENNDKIVTSPKQTRNNVDSSKVSSIINTFNLQKHHNDDKNRQHSKGGFFDKNHNDSLKDVSRLNKESAVRKMAASISKFETTVSEERSDVQAEETPPKQNYPKSFKPSCCGVYDKSIDGKLFPSLLQRAQDDNIEQLSSGLIHLYHAGGYWTGSLPKELSSNLCKNQHLMKRGLYAVQSEPDNPHYMFDGGLTRVGSLVDEAAAGGIGVVRANTGRQLSDSRYRTELEIFFRSGVLAQLEAQRDERLTDHVVQLQARCRGYLARRKLAKIKIQDMAVRCIQRNVRKFLLVREWPWWRLLVRVVPLLNVHRTEEQLRQKTEELEALRVKVEALEQERNHLKHDNDKLEAKNAEENNLMMLPGNVKLGSSNLNNKPAAVSSADGNSSTQTTKRIIQPAKKAFTTGGLTEKLIGVNGTACAPPLPTRSIGAANLVPPLPPRPSVPFRRSYVFTGHQPQAPTSHTQPTPSRDTFSPIRDVFSPSRQIFSPVRDVASPRRDLLSPRRDLLSPNRQLYSPTREYLSPNRNLLSPNREVMSPTRKTFSPRRDIFSPTRLSPPKYLSPRDVASPNGRCFSPRSRSSRSTSIASGTSYLSSREGSPTGSISTFSPSYSTSKNVLSSGAIGPRRVFPQTSTNIDLETIDERDKSPVVFEGGMSFVMGGKKSPVMQQLKPMPAHLDPTTASSHLSNKISDFLRKSDHVMEEWKRIGRKDPDADTKASLPPGHRGSSKSVTNILIKGFQLLSRQEPTPRTRSRASQDTLDDDDFYADTLAEADEVARNMPVRQNANLTQNGLSEMTADLAEEHSTATLATERLEVETSDRLRLEKELQEVQNHNKSLSQQGERLEMELLCLRAADMNGVLGSEEDDEDGEGDSGVYKQRYERTLRELEFTRRRLQQQHEDDLEQLVALKKQLEKKLADAYEEVEEQRQVVAQWKRKVQKLNADHNDLHLLLEEQNSRNNLLEKKQRKFDSELQLLQDELRQERQQHERASREKEIALAEKYTLEQNISGIRLELELKEDRVTSLTQELDELMFGGKTEEEVAHLKKTKHELDKKLKEQEEELDDLAGQVQILEQSKLRLEMSLEQQRKEARRELSQRDEELEDVRCNAQKKVKALEAQLESEHDERTQLVRERHELERRLAVLEEQNRAARVTDEDTLHRLRRDLRRTKALLRDAQTMLERARGESPGKVVIRQLRNQLEDTEVARAAAVKARQAAELELAETQAQLEEVQRARQEAEERASLAARERSELQSQLEENEEELAEVLKKYRAAVQQLSVDQMALQEQAGRVAELESERASLREQLAEMGSRLENMETLGDPSSSLAQKRLELRAKELESKLELEQTTRSRLEVQITRLKEAVEKLQDEIAGLRTKEQAAQDAARRLQRQLREAREEQAAVAAREAESVHRRKELEKRLEGAEAEAAGARGDLRLALARIEDLQAAMQGELEEESSGSDPDRTESDHDSDGSDESINTFLANHKVRMNSSPRSNRPSLDLDLSPRSLEVPAKKTAETAGKESFA